MVSIFHLVLLLLYISSAENNEETLIISSITDAIRVNVHFNVTNNKNYSSASPNPDITILSQDYFLCLWSYVIKNENNNTYSNEIYSNLFSFKTGKSMVRTEYLLNKLRGYSQDTPSATTLFNTSNHLTHAVAVVWESQITDTQTNNIIDAIFGRIIRWSITHNNGYRYVKVTSPQSKEFQISSPSIDYLHHKNPNVIPIYNTGKFLVSWISHDNNENINYNMVFIRIYYNSGRPYSEQIPIHKTDLYWKKYPHSIPLLYNLTLISWLTQSYNNQLIIYGMIFDDKGNNTFTDEDRYTFTTIADNIDHTIYNKTVPIITSLHNNPVDNNNYFMLAYNSINIKQETNTMYGIVYVYNYETNIIKKISDITSLFKKPYDINKYIIQSPQIENIENQLYELENGLNAKIALCFTIKDLIFDKSDILCKIFEISLWNNQDEGGESISANIEIITDAKMINDISLKNHRHEYPSISSESILRAQTDYTDDPQFVVAWSNSRSGGYDVYTKILKVDHGDNDNNGGNGDGDKSLPIDKLNLIIIGVVFGVIFVVLAICICNHFYLKHKDNLKLKPRSKMQQLGEESDDDDDEDEDGHAESGGLHTTTNITDDGLQLT